MSSPSDADLDAVTSHASYEIEVTLQDGPDGAPLASGYMERDPSRRESKVRTSKGPVTGRRVRLRSPRGEESLRVPSTPGKVQWLRVRIGGLELEGKISPPLPEYHRADDPPLERQIGSMRADGVAVQLRFKTAERTDKTLEPIQYVLYDGAFTADEHATDGIEAIEAAGELVYTPARDVIAQTRPAPRVGRIIDIWMPQKFEKGSEHWKEDDPDRLQYDGRGRERNEELLFEIRRETEAWEATGRDNAVLLKKRRDVRRWDLALAQNRRSILKDLAKHVTETGEERVSVELVEHVKATTTFQKRKTTCDLDVRREDVLPCDEGDKEAVDLIKEDMFEFLDELLEMNAGELTRLHGEINRKCLRCTEGIRRLDQELEDRRQWDIAESGVERRAGERHQTRGHGEDARPRRHHRGCRGEREDTRGGQDEDRGGARRGAVPADGASALLGAAPQAPLRPSSQAGSPRGCRSVRTETSPRHGSVIEMKNVSSARRFVFNTQFFRRLSLSSGRPAPSTRPRCRNPSVTGERRARVPSRGRLG
jgi:hypothetical protein